MKNWDDSEECGICKHWQDVGSVLSDQGACHRYPGRPTLTLHFDWCGEFVLYSEKASLRRQNAVEAHEARYRTPPVDDTPE